MKKDRNTFFNEASFSQSGYIPTPNFNNMPYPNSFPTNQSFYGTESYSSDLESRLAKIERNLNRLDARLSKLENSNILNQTENPTNMYML